MLGGLGQQGAYLLHLQCPGLCLELTHNTVLLPCLPHSPCRTVMFVDEQGQKVSRQRLELVSE